ncbi:PRA1 family protein F3 [Raphanus sativus]|uniref:PRA1 family protein n=1 Tax=Raphanus sativus TaxID=3726 RepID=A0A6J0JPU6_RAPSA|nr:PRA1 family protein F3-like [Raphanus sativus]XP_056854048.1 PRA1 family protein F3-like [Raphanus sativus]KAJ4870612.1 PRA1 family protein F3 [Raphanus sativus]KAJ4886519.1 PRA1 family protein F3 [Raphanus sativus]
MTNYNAIPASAHASPSPVVDVESLSSHNQCTTCAMPRRPWGVMFDIHSMGLPHGLSDASSRFKTNYNHFRTNYEIFFTINILAPIFVSLINHLLSLIAFTVLVSVYTFLYFLQDDVEPIELFRCKISDRMIRIVKSCLILLAIGLLVVTHARDVIYGWPLVIVYVPILIHTVVRKTEDLFLSVEAATMTEASRNSLRSHVLFALFNLYLSFGL